MEGLSRKEVEALKRVLESVKSSMAYDGRYGAGFFFPDRCFKLVLSGEEMGIIDGLRLRLS